MAAPQSSDFWDSLPDAGASAQPQPIQASNKSTSDMGNFWDSLPDAPPEPQKPASIPQDMGRSLASGAAQGLLDLPNAPKHLAQLMAQSVTRPAGEAYSYLADKTGLPPLSQGMAEGLTYPIENPNNPTATDMLTKQVIPAGVQAVTGANINYEPKTKLGEYSQSIGKMAPFAADPEMGILRSTGMGIGAQAGSDIGGTISDKPEARELGGLIGGIAGGNARDIGSAGIKPVYNAAKEFADNSGFGKKVVALSPDVQATQGQVNQAVKNIRGAANNPDSLLPSIDNNAGEIVPGSKPTMAEISPDQGLAQYQDAMRSNNPAPFQDRAAEQNTARAQAVTAVKGSGNPDSLGEYFANRLQDEDNALRNKEGSAQQAVSSKGVALGRYGELPREGATNDAIQNAQIARKETASDAWKVLEPYKNSPADLNALRQAAGDVHKEASQYGAQALEPEVTRITQDALRPPDPGTDNLGALQRFRSNISDAQREVKAGSQSMRYLQMLKNSVDKGIENTVNGLVDNENKAVAAGQIAQENTLATNLAKHQEQYYANKQSTARANTANGMQYNAARGYPSVSGVSRAEGQTARRTGNPDSGEGIPPAFGAEQKQQYESARSLTFRHETLSRLENSGVVNPDGTIDAAKYDRWYQKNKSLFKSNKEFGEQLSDWRTAQEHLNNVRAERVTHEKDFQYSRAASIIKNDPVNEIGRIFNSKTKYPVKEFSSLVGKVKSDKSATEGLKAAVAEHILDKVGKIETEEVEGKTQGQVRRPQAYRDFIKQHRESLKIIYGDQLQDLENVASDIKRTQEYNARAKIPGQSNTTKDAIQAAKQKTSSLLSRVLKLGPVGGGIVGALFGHIGAGVGAGEAGKAIDAFLSKGLTTVKAIELEMMLHPSTFGKAMLENIPAEKIPLPIQKRIASSIIKTLPPAAKAISAKPSGSKGDDK